MLRGLVAVAVALATTGVAVAGAAPANAMVSHWATWATDPAAKVYAGDFNNDGYDDLAMTGPYGWSSLPVAFSNGDGTFNVTNAPIGANWATWAAEPKAKIAVGDVNGDQKADLIMTGPDLFWYVVKVALSNGDGTFNVVNYSAPGDWFLWASDPAAKLAAGDVNADGLTDLMLTGPAHWTTLPVAFATTNYSFTITNRPVHRWWLDWVSDPKAKILSGDFDGDGRADLTQVGSNTHGGDVHNLLSKGNGDFTAQVARSDLNTLSSKPGAQTLAGDYYFNVGVGKRDDWLVVGDSNTTQITAYGQDVVPPYNTIHSRTYSVGDFERWAALPGVKAAGGDFDGDGLSDAALTGGAGWSSLPVAFKRTPDAFWVANHPIP